VTGACAVPLGVQCRCMRCCPSRADKARRGRLGARDGRRMRGAGRVGEGLGAPGAGQRPSRVGQGRAHGVRSRELVGSVSWSMA
jgi:hypothetical protein